VATNVSEEHSSSTFNVGSSFFYLEDGAVCSTKTLVTTGYNNPKDCSMDLHYCETGNEFLERLQNIQCVLL
jgi:hypothetical protein